MEDLNEEDVSRLIISFAVMKYKSSAIVQFAQRINRLMALTM